MRFKQTQVIVLANQKGGCGKTTTAISVAAAFNKLGYSVALIDTDPQCNATTSFGLDPHELFNESKLSILDAYIDKRSAIDIAIDLDPARFPTRFSILASNQQLGEVGPHLEMEAMMSTRFNRSGRAEISIDDLRHEHRQRLKNSINSLRGVFDVVIIDTPPNLGYVMTTALVASDWFIIPVFPSKFDLAGLEELTKTIAKVKELYNPELRLAGVLVGNFDKSAKLDRDIYQKLSEKFGEGAMFETTIGRGVKMRELTFSNQTIFEFQPASQQAEQFLALVKEMLNRASKGENTARPLPKIEAVIEHSERSGIDLTKFVPQRDDAVPDDINPFQTSEYEEVGNG